MLSTNSESPCLEMRRHVMVAIIVMDKIALIFTWGCLPLSTQGPWSFAVCGLTYPWYAFPCPVYSLHQG